MSSKFKAEPKEEKEACPVPKPGKACEHEARKLPDGGDHVVLHHSDVKLVLCSKCKGVYWIG